MKIVCALLAAFAFGASAAVIDNDESCDVAPLPAATLLLPYFEVDLDDQTGETTIFTITNVTNLDRIAHVTLWNDASEPVTGFNIYLTGYDVQSINLYDVLERGLIAPDYGTGTQITKRKTYSDVNPSVDLTNCARLPGQLDDAVIEHMQDALTRHHEHAIGYATVDVVGDCTTSSPLDTSYWTDDLRYDNALIGDYKQVARAQNFAQGGPMVHIRVIPDGKPPRVNSEFERTFYSRFGSTRDGRQPLPSRFAAHWIAGGAQLQTLLKIWRQTPGDVEIVVFDENENATTHTIASLPAASAMMPQTPSGATGGWIYLNALDDQSWVVSSMRAEGRYSVDSEASALGNGCSARVREGAPIAPSPNVAPHATLKATANNDDSCDVAPLPAATLLLPYFEVDYEDFFGETTLFTVTNVSPEKRVAHVTLWTDYAVAVLDFNLALDAYDSQSINLRDLLTYGTIAGGCPQATLPASVVERLQYAFSSGIETGVCNNIGNEHDNAVGFATIDLVAGCTAHSPVEREYWREDIRYDNVLIGDYQQVHSDNDFAQGGPMVHIRAIPEGGTPQMRLNEPEKWEVAFPYTFYRRHQSSKTPKLDGRQPLPSLFASRWISGGASDFTTWLKVWREGKQATTECRLFDDRAWTKIVEIARFDEEENATADLGSCYPYPFCALSELPATSLTSVLDADLYPQLANGAVAGWIYFNLDDDEYDSTARQGWIITSMRTEGRFSTDNDAIALGNGCSPAVEESEIVNGEVVIGPPP